MKGRNLTRTLGLLMAMLFFGMHAQAQLNADFNANTTFSCTAPFTVNFTDLSTTSSGTITAWRWDFGDGAVSLLQNPTHLYTQLGTYTVKLVAVNSLGEEDSVTMTGYIQIGSNLDVSVNNVSPITCLDDGEVSATGIGGVAPYTYAWSNGQTTANATNLMLNDAWWGLEVVVTDAAGCTTRDSIYPVYNPTISTSATVTTIPTCGGPTDGVITVTASNGTAPYEYSIDNITFQSSNVLTGVAAGMNGYFVRDFNGCVVNDSIFVPSTPINVTLAITQPISCNGLADGEITSTVTGGTAPYTYNWTPVATPTAGGEGITNLAAGSYTVIVSDMNGCDQTASISITQPSVITVSAVITRASCGTCADGAIQLATSGGTPAYTYLWNTAANSANITNLIPASYGVTVTDANGCTAANSFIVDTLCNTYTVDLFPVNCGLVNNGEIFIYPNGVHMPWTYLWSNGSTTNNSNSVGVGTYYVTITNAVGCVSIDSFEMFTADSISMSGTTSQASCISCPDGAVDANVTGGVPPYSYLWSTGATTEDISGVVPGYYEVTVTDAQGCTNARGFWVSNTCSINLFIGNDTTVCLGTFQIFPSVSGGIAPYTYLWSTGAVTQSITVSVGGTYHFTVTDDNACQVHDSVTINDGAGSVFVIDDTTICDGNAVTLGAWGGTSYLWSPAGSLSNPTLANPVATPTANTTYTVEVTTSFGCTVNQTVEVLLDADCVWPGDANADGVADNDDVLAIGIGYGDTGPFRWHRTLVWEAQATDDWTNALPSGANHKHVDTDGDGTINSDDTLAISQNYGLTHLKGDDERETNMPTIYIVLPDSVSAGQTVTGQVYLGSDSFPLTDMYGIKFSMNFNPDYIEENSVGFNFGTSWMGTPGVDMITFQKELHGSGRIDAAITGINHINRSGFGLLGTANFTMKDDISGKDFIATPMLFDFTNIRAISVSEAEIDVAGEETSIVATQVVGIGQVKNTLPVSIYPNPAQDVLYINTYNQPVQYISVHNALGSLIEVPTTEHGGSYKLETGHLPSGIYMVTIQSGSHVTTQRVVLSK